MGLKDKINAAMERANAGRQAKLGAKSDVAYAQGNAKKGAKLEMRSKKVALRSEKRQAISDAKNSMKRPQTGEINFQNDYKKKAFESAHDALNKRLIQTMQTKSIKVEKP